MGLYSSIGALYESDEEFEDDELTVDEKKCCEAADLMEFVIEMHEAEGRLFDFLIESDFISARNHMIQLEDGDSVEAAEKEDSKNDKNTAQKIKEFIVNTIQAFMRKIRQFYETIKAKFIEMIKKDETLKGWVANITMENCKGFKGIANFNLPNITGYPVNQLMENLDSCKELTEAAINSTGDETAFAEKEAALKTKLDSAKNTAAKKLGTPEKVWTPNAQELHYIQGYIRDAGNTKKTVAEIQEASDKTVKYLKETLDKIKKEKSSSKEDKAKLNKMRVRITKMINIIRDISSTYANVFKKAAAARRKAFILVGSYCNKKKAPKAEGEKKEEEVKTESYISIYGAGIVSTAASVSESSSMSDDLYAFILSEACDDFAENYIL